MQEIQRNSLLLGREQWLRSLLRQEPLAVGFHSEWRWLTPVASSAWVPRHGAGSPTPSHAELLSTN